MDIEVSPSFKKRLSKKTASKTGAIMRCIEKLSENPRHPGLRTSRVGGTEDVWEARIDGGNRLTFRLEGAKLVLLNHCNHDMLRRPN